MIAFLFLAALLLPGPQDSGQTGADEPPQLTRIVDERAARQCMGALVGFSNVRVRCTVASDAAMRQCEILTTNRNILRYRARFECMAAATRVYEADGSPALGRVVELAVNGASQFSNPRR